MIAGFVILTFGLVGLVGALLFWLMRRQAPPPPAPPPDPVAQLRQEIEAGRRWVAELRRGRQSLQASLRGPAAEAEFISAAAELLATRLSIALEAYEVDGLLLQLGERLRGLEEEMRRRPQPQLPTGQPGQD